jgi:hypothetical protein
MLLGQVVTPDIEDPRRPFILKRSVILVVTLLRVRNLLRCLFGNALNPLRCCCVRHFSFSGFVTSGFSNCSGMVALSFHHDEPCSDQFLVSFARPFGRASFR